MSTISRTIGTETNRSELPLLGFVTGTVLSIALWAGLVGVVWLLVTAR